MPFKAFIHGWIYSIQNKFKFDNPHFAQQIQAFFKMKNFCPRQEGLQVGFSLDILGVFFCAF